MSKAPPVFWWGFFVFEALDVKIDCMKAEEERDPMASWIAGKQASHAEASVPVRRVAWRAPRGVVVPVPEPIPHATAQALGLVIMGSDAQGEPTAYMKPERATEPDEVMLPRQVAKARRAGPVATDGSTSPDAARWNGLRTIVARECDVDNRWGGKDMGEYYAEKYPPFVRMASREADIKQRAAVIASREGR